MLDSPSHCAPMETFGREQRRGQETRAERVETRAEHASVVRDGVRLLLSGDGSSGKRPLPDGRRQEPGGWNRMHLEVADLPAEVARLRAAGVSFRTNEIVTGPGGTQVILDDPSGNPLELFQPRRREDA